MLDTVAGDALHQAGLDGDDAKRWFRTLVSFGALVHDWGKANGHFQAMVRSRSSSAQLLRHEALSAILALDHPQLASWLASAIAFQGHDAFLLPGAVYVAAGHHLKFHPNPSQDGVSRGPLRLQGVGSTVTLFLSHPDFAATLEIGKKLGLAAPPALKDVVWKSFDPLDDSTEMIQGALFDRNQGMLMPVGRGARWWATLDSRQRRVVALAKAWVVAADVAGSAIAREDHLSVLHWIPKVLKAVPHPDMLDRVVVERLKGKQLRPFQKAIADSTQTVTLVEAGCGTGKTAAAYAWAAALGQAGHRGKLFFAYPTTGTATEGFVDYVAGSDGLEARLIHGRSAVDLEDLLVTHDQPSDEQHVRNESLDHLRSEVVICTVDTVLGLVQNQRRGLFLAPALSTGRFVFDEVHAYDDRMFAALLDFLRAFPRAPVLLMSASVPAGRRAAIEEVTGPLTSTARPHDVEAVSRYVFGPVTESHDVWSEVEQCLANGGKVLWVSNTVARAMNVGIEGARRGLPVRCYHSRYRYEDRVKRHREVVDAFDAAGGAVLAVTTQVAEMSLDLSANLLVTDLAPVPAMVQRLGRLNRRATPDEPGEPGRALAINVKQPLPYTSIDLDQGRSFWEAMANDGLPRTQKDLNDRMHVVLGAAPWPPAGDRAVTSVWLEGGYESQPGELREAEGTATVLLEEDIPRVQSAHVRGAEEARREILRCALPIPARPEIWKWRRISEAPFHPVAPKDEIAYDPVWGARWVTNDAMKGRTDG